MAMTIYAKGVFSSFPCLLQINTVMIATIDLEKKGKT